MPTPSKIKFFYDPRGQVIRTNCELARDGATIEKEEYYPFGETSFASYGKKRYKYCGKERDTESGLYYYEARYYNAWTCRFLGVDPLKDKYHYYTPYQYAGNKTIIAVDLDGKEERETQNDKTIIRGTYTISDEVIRMMRLDTSNKPGKPDKLKKLEIGINEIFNSKPKTNNTETKDDPKVIFEFSIVSETKYKEEGGLWDENKGPIDSNSYSLGGKILMGSMDDPEFVKKFSDSNKIVAAYYLNNTIILNPAYFDKTNPKFHGFGTSLDMNAMDISSISIGGAQTSYEGTEVGTIVHEIGHDLGLDHIDANGVNDYPKNGLMSVDPKFPTKDELNIIISPDNFKLIPKN